MKTRKTTTLIFLIDTSGSMRDQKISSVNAALTECMEVLNKKRLQSDEQLTVGYITFSNKMDPVVWCKQLVPPNLYIKPNKDGFYSIASFKCLYDGLYDFLNSAGYLGQLYIILLTDGKATERRREYDESFERINSLNAFRNARRYAAIVDIDTDKGLAENVADNDILEFLSGNDAKKRFKLVNLSEEISKLYLFEEDGDDAGKKKQIASIFGD